MDPDGSSLCDAVAKGALVPVNGFTFADAPRSQRCVLCEAILRL